MSALPVGDRLLTPQEVADLLKRTPRALAQLRYLGTGPAFIRTGSTIRYRRRDVEAWLDVNTRTVTR